MSDSWYVLHSKPRKEEFLCSQLLLHELEAYCPQIRVQPINPRARRSKPYFPGYVFVRADLEQNKLSALRWMPGVDGVVSFDREPAHVPGSLIWAIRQRVEQVNRRGGELLESMKAGDTVLIQDGPFAGYEAIFDTRLAGSDRVRVLLKLLQKRQVALELSVGQIQNQKRC